LKRWLQSWIDERTHTHTRKVHQLEEVDMLTIKIDLLMRKLEDLSLDHRKMVDTRMTCEECEEMGHMGVNCLTVYQDINFVGNSNNGFRPNQGFNLGWSKPNFSSDNRQQGGNGQNFNRNEPSLRDIVRDQLRINAEFSKKLLANDKVLENINSKMNNFTMVVQNHLSFNNLLETQIAQLASSLPYPNDMDFLGQQATPVKENVKAVITRSGKSTIEPKTSSKKTTPIELNEEGSKVEANVEAVPRTEKE
jgi:hypothetical protein